MLAEQTQKWFPTHVQVTVLQGKDLKPKGKSGTNDAYTIIQLGKEKYSTSVAEKTLDPIWKEEASFELPGLLMEGNSERYILYLIVMHRSLVGLDKFLGQVAINLNEIFEDKLRRKTEWFTLESKQGKRTKDRGEIKVNIQFMRNNMTASMFDLSMKDKTKSPFAKLKDKMKGRKTDGTILDTSSAIIPSTHVPETNNISFLNEIQLKSKPKKPFLLGPQRLSLAHSMSDLSGPQITSEKTGTIANTYLFRRQLESENESGNLKSPHRRTLSADTTKVNQLDSTIDDSDSAFGAQSDPFTNVSASLPQKFATLPRQKNPFEENPLSWDQNIGLFSKRTEIKKDIKKEKKEKVSLFERVTGKKESKRSDRLINGGLDSSCDLKSPSAFGENHKDSFDFDSANPFTTNFKSKSVLPSSSHNVNSENSEDLRKTVDGNPFEAATGYPNLTYEEVLQELAKHKEQLKKKDTHIRELEDYIDNLLVRVMEETPSILRVPYEPSRRAGKFSKT